MGEECRPDGRMGDLSGTCSGGRRVHAMPSDHAAAAELKKWAIQEDTTLDLCGFDASGVDLSGCDLALALFVESCLRDANLAATDLYRANFQGSAPDHADFTRASLVKAVLDGSSMHAAMLSEADLGSSELAEVDARSASFHSARLNGASFLDTRLEGADLTEASVQDTSFRVLLDEHTTVQGLHGTLYGPARISEKGTTRELAGLELELWLNQRGASVHVLNSPADAVTYYALTSESYPRSNPEGIVRRRRAGNFTSDETFTRNLRWEPTEYFRLCELGHNKEEHIEITENEVRHFISRIAVRLGNNPTA